MDSSYWSLYRRAKKRTHGDLLELNKETFDAGDVVDEHAHFEERLDDCKESECSSRITDTTCSIATSFDGPDGAYNESEQLGSDDDPLSSDSDSDFCEYSSSGLTEEGASCQSIELVPEQLSKWSIEYNATHSSINALLKIFKPHIPILPSDARTLLHTPRQVEVTKSNGGEYLHCGLVKQLKSLLESCSFADGQEIEVQFNIDGLPLFKSSKKELWPILCRIRKPGFVEPLVVGIWCGEGKPNISFLNDFVSELKDLLNQGLELDSMHIPFVVHSFVCDAPARAFVKCIKLHSGYSSCEKCDQHGEWDTKVVFESKAGNLRTDDQFMNRTDEDHHLPDKISPLTSLSIGMVSQFPLDPMHLLYLGVMRKLLNSWIRSPPDLTAVRLPARTVSQISAHLLILGPYIPSEFNRRPRSLAEIDRWKATEFRLFLLYSGVVVLRPALRDELFKHFLLLFVATTILSSSKLCKKFVTYANGLLQTFVLGVRELYGRKLVVYNIHGLLHIASDCERFGCLENFSAFCFENKLKSIKRLVRKASLPLQQLARRLVELERHSIKSVAVSAESHNASLFLSREHERGPVTSGFCMVKQYHKMVMNGVCFSVNQRDSCVQLSDKSVVLIQNIVQDESGVHIIHKNFTKVVDLFAYPLRSTSLGICKVSNLAHGYSVAKVDHISCKCVLLPTTMDQTEFAALPLLHSNTAM